MGTEDLSEEDKEKGKALGAAWIKNDKVNECKQALQGSSIYLFGLPGCRSKEIGLAIARRLETYRFFSTPPIALASSSLAAARDAEEQVLGRGRGYGPCRWQA